MTDERSRATFPFGDFEPKESSSKKEEDIAKKVAEDAGFVTRHDTKKETSSRNNKKIDGRSLRATGRKEQLNISVTSEFKNKFWKMAKDENITVGEELITMLMDFYLSKKDSK